MLETMLDKFIPEGISSRVVMINQDHSERKGYGANLTTNNDENDLHHAVGNAGLDDPTAIDPLQPTHTHQPYNTATGSQQAIYSNQTTNTATDSYWPPTAIRPDQPTQSDQPIDTVLRVSPRMMLLRILGNRLIPYQAQYAMMEKVTWLALFSPWVF